MKKPLMIVTGLTLAVLAARASSATPVKTVVLEPYGEIADGEKSKVAGKADFEVLSDGMTKVTVTLENLPANSTHALHIHKGDCENQGGIQVFIPDIVADAKGKGMVEKLFKTGALAAKSYIYVHKTSTEEGITPEGIACGDLK